LPQKVLFFRYFIFVDLVLFLAVDFCPVFAQQLCLLQHRESGFFLLVRRVTIFFSSLLTWILSLACTLSACAAKPEVWA
jgi:hypothetical protein